MAKTKWKERQKRKLRTRTKPLTLDALKEYGALERMAAPTGPFDPNGAWEHVYQIWLVQSWNNEAGHMRLKRTVGDDGSVTLEVDQTIIQSAGTQHVTRATIKCANDALARPVSWHISSTILGVDREPIADTVVEESATVADGQVRIASNAGALVRDVPAPFTCNWSLIDAVQRLPGKATQPLRFTLLEDLDLVKPEHTLSYRRAVEFDLNGRPLRLDVYDHLGRGMLPEQFLVDEQHRVVFAISGIRAYLLHPGAAERTQKRIEWNAQKRKRSKKQ